MLMSRANMKLFIFADEMLENENDTLRERVGDMEKKVYEQRDEILCLRATLADVLRRVTNLEGSRGNLSFTFF
jgi:hypothetical protein